ncbi:HAMP domain-containing histidine kinase [Clostridium senegalense]|uniref:sensor histidine kinase n=1 Tax=Clostridium senegalense TaxID=1465809 RepID=UPI001C0F8F51|nr:HAMP domain-containing sensor histidine kinase [Clostridium senegalense]MBU5225895.1 HAMP domain-containing histidine kinase [Clostridium senegalense]
MKTGTNKITKRILKYFLLSTVLVMGLGYIFSTVLLGKVYIKQQYNELEKISGQIESEYKMYGTYSSSLVLGIISEGGNSHCFGPGKMMWLNKVDVEKLKEKDILVTNKREKYLTYKKSTDSGYIVVMKSYYDTKEYINLIYLILAIIFMVSIIISNPLAIYLGRRFTKPIIDLKQASDEIAKENFDVHINVKTGDEIEELAQSIKKMSKEISYKYNLQREFIANVSHDFKTPLSIIKNYSEAIGDELVKGEEVKEYSEIIIEEVDRLNRLVSEILQLSKIKEGKVNMNFERISITHIIKECVKKISFMSNNNFRIIVINNFNYDVFIKGDEIYLYRVIYNLIDNSIKHSCGDSIKIILEDVSDNVKISIRDNGKGIDEEIVGEVWDRYLKNKSSGGMGIGLSISKEILLKHEFSYGARNLKESGVEFYFIIPKDKVL